MAKDRWWDIFFVATWFKPKICESVYKSIVKEISVISRMDQKDFRINRCENVAKVEVMFKILQANRDEMPEEIRKETIKFFRNLPERFEQIGEHLTGDFIREVLSDFINHP